MSNQEISSDLEKLREEVAALSAANQAKQAELDAKEAEVEAAHKESAATPDLEDPDQPEGIKSQLDELGSLLETEIRDLPTITCLAVFSLGILLGRHLR